MDFERIDDCRARSKIHGGWLVETVLRVNSLVEQSTSIAACFVPDPQHEWLLEDDLTGSDIVTGD